MSGELGGRMNEFADLDRATVAALRAVMAGDGLGLNAILESVDLRAFIEHVLTWTVALGAGEHGGRDGFDTLLSHYQRGTRAV